MKRSVLWIALVCLLAAGGLWWSSTAFAGSTPVYTVLKSNIGPAQAGSAGAYKLSSSVGQPDAGQGTAGNYTLGGGFWGGGAIISAVAHYFLELPLMLR